jgi:hypothetical protein
MRRAGSCGIRRRGVDHPALAVPSEAVLASEFEALRARLAAARRRDELDSEELQRLAVDIDALADYLHRLNDGNEF